MGPGKFEETAASYGLTLTAAEADAAVRGFRTANKPIVDLWRACERAAKEAIRNPSSIFAVKKLQFRMASPTGRLSGSLLMELPSGRNLVYRNVRLDNDSIVYWGVDQYTRQWKELRTYGGKIVENATQAVARDLLADAVIALDEAWPDTLCTTVHDEIVALTDDEHAEWLLKVMKFYMSAPTAPWAHGMPLSAAGAVIKRYAKL
jgi:DNA polymerase